MRAYSTKWAQAEAVLNCAWPRLAPWEHREHLGAFATSGGGVVSGFAAATIIRNSFRCEGEPQRNESEYAEHLVLIEATLAIERLRGLK